MDKEDALNKTPTRHVINFNVLDDFSDVEFDHEFAIDLTIVLNSLFRSHKHFCGYNPKLYLLPSRYKNKDEKKYLIGPISPEHFYYNLFEWDHVEIICEADAIFGYTIMEILITYLMG